MTNALLIRQALLLALLQIDWQFLTQIFNVFVLLYLEYGSCIWSPHLLENIDIIESVQRRYTKRYHEMWDVSYPERLKILGLDSLEIRRLRNDLYECFKILKNFSPLNKSEFFEPPRLHSRLHLAKTRSKCNERYHFFSNRVVDIFNGLPDVVVQARTVNHFKSALNRYENQFEISPLSRFFKGRGLQ